MMMQECFKDEIHRVTGEAQRFLSKKEESVTDITCENSPGSANDYYSNGDYWWPNENTKNGLPFVRKDGQSYPGAFFEHRRILTDTSYAIGTLSLAYLLTGNQNYFKKALSHMNVFFVHPKTKMNPSLLYAQAIPGICTGRGIGIIDTLHLIDTAVSVKLLKDIAKNDEDIRILQGVTDWFEQYLSWMLHHPYGISELNEKNNHSICFCVQAATFASISGQKSVLKLCKEKFTEYLNRQMAPDGSFPLELARTKPYGYSLFVVDNLTTLALILSLDSEEVLNEKGKDGQTLEKALEFIYPYIKDKELWPYAKDVEHYESLPIGFPFLLTAGMRFGKDRFKSLWLSLPHTSNDKEVMRNTAIKNPLLWLKYLRLSC